MDATQCDMARAVLGLSRHGLGERANLSGSTVVGFEGGRRVGVHGVAAMQRALEEAGVDFIPAGAIVRVGGTAAGPGVRLRS